MGHTSSKEVGKPVQEYSFFHYMPSNPQIRCVAADILWQPSSLRCVGISSTM